MSNNSNNFNQNKIFNFKDIVNLNNNNNNNNINNVNNNQYQFVTHENLFNSNITSLPPFNFQIQNNYQQTIFLNNKNKFNREENFNKSYKEEKYKDLINSQKKLRFIKNYGNKIKEMNYTKNDNNDVFIDEYIMKIKEIYQDKDSYYDYINRNGFYNFSECPFCGAPAIFIFGKILCINKCFMTTVSDDTFDQNYTLSNFIEQYKDYYSKHLNCKSDLITLYVDMESKCAEFLCSKCQIDYLNFENLKNI